MKRNPILFLILFFIIFLIPTHAQQREGDLAVLEITFSGSELTKEQIGFLSDDIRGIAAKITNYRIMNKENIWTILRDKNIDPNKCVEAECEVDYGRILQADMVVTTNIIYAGGVYFIKMKMYDVSRATLENSVDRECAGCDFSKLRESVKDGAQELFGGVEEIGGFERTVPGERGGAVPPGQRMEMGSIRIETEPAGASIFIDGEEKGVSPLEASVLVGERTIVIAKKGYSASTEVINIEKGKKKILRRSLAPEMGGIEVSLAGAPYLFEPGRAKVFLDGRYRGNMPEEGKSLKIANILAGEHIVRVEHPDYEVKEASVLVRHNVTEDVRIELKGKPGKVVVVTTPLGAEVEIDGKKVGVTPFNTALEPGRHRISISLKGYKTEIKEIDVTPNKPLTLNISLEVVKEVEGVEEMVRKGEKRRARGLFIYPLINYYLEYIGGWTYGGGIGYKIRDLNLLALGMQFSAGELSGDGVSGSAYFVEFYGMAGYGYKGVGLYIKPSLNFQGISGNGRENTGVGARFEVGGFVFYKPICFFVGLFTGGETGGIVFSMGGYF